MIIETLEEDLHKAIKSNKQVISRPIRVGKASYVLSQCGVKADQDITITKKVISKAMRCENRDENRRLVGNTGHGLTETHIVSAIKELESPIMIFRGRNEKSLLVITSILDLKGRHIVIAMECERQEGFTSVTSIRSIYGRDNLAFFIGENIENGNLLAAKRKEADELLRSIGKSYPKENTFISFN